MTRKFFALLLAAMLLLTSMPALADGGDSRLTSLTHNCPNTGKMLPEVFNPNQLSYILTVADWVSRVTFTPTADGVIYVNGVQVPSGQKSQVIQMTDEPQQVTIQVQNGTTTTYTVFLQRRPSEKRTRV
ncbi:MAG: cadherin-like beta sandwich domain-containing protein, partial [Clostridia bacterium]|nr:cadherin-like beta sandwich domain-containing protein [Clostridia bacterium]